MEKIEKVVLGVVLLLVAIGVIIAFYDLRMYEGLYVKEDGFIEWLTVMALLAGAYLSFYRAIKIKGSKGKLFLLASIFFGAVFIFGAGEEISWGQRIFNVESPDFFVKHNSQGETNLHNLVVKGKKINKIIFGTFLGVCIATYLLILPVLYRKQEKIKALVNLVGIPIAQNRHIICYFILFLLVTITPSPKRGELLEFGGCFFFFLIFWMPLNAEVFNLKNKA